MNLSDWMTAALTVAVMAGLFEHLVGRFMVLVITK
jgi:hypothetical protein